MEDVFGMNKIDFKHSLKVQGISKRLNGELWSVRPRWTCFEIVVPILLFYPCFWRMW